MPTRSDVCDFGFLKLTIFDVLRVGLVVLKVPERDSALFRAF